MPNVPGSRHGLPTFFLSNMHLVLYECALLFGLLALRIRHRPVETFEGEGALRTLFTPLLNCTLSKQCCTVLKKTCDYKDIYKDYRLDMT